MCRDGEYDGLQLRHKNKYRQTEAFKELQRRAFIYSSGMKHRPTKAEAALADALKAHGIMFKQQGYFFTDTSFYIPDFRLATKNHKLIVEVDGSSHARQVEYDEKRTEWLAKNRNCKVVRFTNEQVLTDINSVIKEILSYHPKTLRQKHTDKSKGTPKVTESYEWSFFQWHFSE
jgi:very-short-patch-repair endonuclease